MNPEQKGVVRQVEPRERPDCFTFVFRKGRVQVSSKPGSCRRCLQFVDDALHLFSIFAGEKPSLLTGFIVISADGVTFIFKSLLNSFEFWIGAHDFDRCLIRLLRHDVLSTRFQTDFHRLVSSSAPEGSTIRPQCLNMKATELGAERAAVRGKDVMDIKTVRTLLSVAAR